MAAEVSCWDLGTASAIKRAACEPPFFVYLEQRGAYFLLAVKHCRRKEFQMIRDLLNHGQMALLQARKHER